MCIGSTVTIRSPTRAGGGGGGRSGGMLPREFFDKNGAIWCNLGVQKYAITKVKINHFKVNKSTTTKVNCYNPP